MENWFTRHNIDMKDKNIYQLLSLCGIDSFDEYILDTNQELVEKHNRQLTVEDFVEISTHWFRNINSDTHEYYKQFDDLYDYEIAALQAHLERIINT